MRILLSNDDGIHAIGLRTLYAALRAAGHTVLTVAPLSEQSAASSRITILDPLRFRTVRDGDFTGIGISGTPADCVLVGLNEFCTAPEERPDLVVAGINAGHNIGYDVLYSGTVAAAREGAQAGIPSLAVSRWMHKADDPAGVASMAARFIDSMDWKSLPSDRIYNLNYPPRPCSEMKDIRLCPLSTTPWATRYERREDLRGQPYLWMGNVPFPYDRYDDAEMTDSMLLREGYITLTPLVTNLTDRTLLERMSASTLL